MYKLIIADDEDNIREGMCSIVNWGELGFEVAFVCADGDEVLRYLEEGGEADALITDIRMVNVSGLSVAKYVMENRPGMRVVFLSGYRDFEYARTAAMYNVRHYLLKPTQLSEIYRVFGEIRQSLDDAHAQRHQERERRRDTERALGLYLERMAGGMASGEDARHAAHLMRIIGLDAEQSPGMMFRILPDADDTQAHDWASVHAAIRRSYDQFILDERHDLHYVPVTDQGASMGYVAYAKGAQADVRELVLRDFLYTTSNLCRLLGVQLHIEFMGVYLGAALVAESADARPEALEAWSGFAGGLSQVCKRILTCLVTEDAEGLRQAGEEVMEGLRNRSASVRLNAIIELVTTLRGQAELSALRQYVTPNYAALSQAGSISAQKAWLTGVLSDVHGRLHPGGQQDDIRIMMRAKAYIDQHYGEAISLKDVAASVYLSPAYFSRLFKQHMQENITDYITRVRVEKAKQLLLDGCYKVYEISERVGYRNEKYFFRIFKKYTGQTPFEYGKRPAAEHRL